MLAREWFDAASDGFRSVVGLIEERDLERPGLGEWDVRALLGHTCRAFVTIEAYLELEPADHHSTLTSPAEYYRRVAAGLADPAEVAQRGREAGRSLGPHPRSEALAIADRVVELVGRTPDATRVTTRLGVMTLIDYLQTRALELTVHGVDLARALGRPVPDELVRALRPSLTLLCDAASSEQQLDLLLTLTGRADLPEGFTLV